MTEIPADFTVCSWWCPASGSSNFMSEHMKRHHDEGDRLNDRDLIADLVAAQVRFERRALDSAILHEIADERIRQDDKWGEQNHPDGTDTKWAVVADGMKAKCQIKADKGTLTFRDIFEEEIWEAYGEEDPERLRAELIQAAAVLVNWIGAIDRRKENDRNCDSGQ